MAAIAYKSEDIIPIITSVLGVSMTTFINYVFKIALEGDYADLKGLVSTEYDDYNTELLSQLEDELTVQMGPCLEDINSCLESFVNIYALPIEEILGDTRITDLADDIFLSLCFDVPEPAKNREDAINNLLWFFHGMLAVLELLCRLVEHEEFDLEDVNENPDDYYNFLIFERVKSENQDTQRLVDLARKLNEYNSLLIELH